MSDLKFKKKIMTGLFWKLMERGGTQFAQFFVQIILARLLLPEEFGLIAIVTVFVVFGNTIVQSGLNVALIQKKVVEEEDYSSVFYSSLIISFLLYILLYFLSPSIAGFYDEKSLVQLLRVLGISLFLGSFNSIQIAIISREMRFKDLFQGSIIGIILSGLVGIGFAKLGFGVWSLVFQQLVNKILIVTILWVKIKWVPKLYFSKKKILELFSFGWKILVSTMLYDLYNNLRALVVGKIFSPQILGFYNRGIQFPDLIVNSVNGSVQSVMLPAFSAQQDNLKYLKSMIKRSIGIISLLIFPAMVGLSVIAEPLVIVVLTERWLPAVPFIQIFAISFSVKPIQSINEQAINAIGRSDITLRTNIRLRIIEVIILITTSFFGIYTIAIGSVISSLIGTIYYVYLSKYYFGYNFVEHIRDISSSLLSSIIMGLMIYLVFYFGFSIYVTLLLQILVGLVVYFIVCKITNNRNLSYVLNILLKILKKLLPKYEKLDTDMLIRELELVHETIHNLSQYRKLLKLYNKALVKYDNRIYERTILGDMKLAFE